MEISIFHGNFDAKTSEMEFLMEMKNLWKFYGNFNIHH
jgi:hypothetical protein